MCVCVCVCVCVCAYVPNCKHWFTTSFLQPLLYLITSQCLKKCQLTSRFFVGAQTVVCLLQTTQIISDVCFIADHVVYAQLKSNHNRLNRDGTLLFTRGGCVSCLRACLGARLLPQSYQYPNLSEGADRVGEQLRGDKEYPLSGVTKSGRVWRKVPESDARSVRTCVCTCASV